MLQVFNAVATNSDPWKNSKRRKALACRELYRHASCAEAWTRELELDHDEAGAKRIELGPVAKLLAPARILTDCKKAYCAELPSKPAVCNQPIPNDNAALVLALTELDAAILSYELDDPEMAKGLAARASFFRVYSIPAEAAALPSASAADEPAPIAVEVFADESLSLNGKTVTQENLAEQVRKLGDPSGLRAVIRADRNAHHGRVIAVLDALKQAGVRKIAFAVSTDAPRAPP